MFQFGRLKPGEKGYGFYLPDSKGKLSSLLDLSQGKKGVLVCFACPHAPESRETIEALKRLHETLSQKGLLVLAVNSDDASLHLADTPEAMASFAAQESLPFPFFSDETQEAARAYGAYSCGDCFLLDAGQNIHFTGALGKEAEDAIAGLLEGKPIPVQKTLPKGTKISWKTRK